MPPTPLILPPHIAAVIHECIEVTLPTPDDFLKVKETLTRIGIASKKDQTLFQSCHILHKQGHYYIIHYKQGFLLDGKHATTQYSESDRARTNTIANLLAQWGLVVLVDAAKSASPVTPISEIAILPFRNKAEWTLESKYEVGRKRRV